MAQEINGRVSAEYIRSLFHYDQETGIITRTSIHHTSHHKIGDQVGYRDKTGYLATRIFLKEYRVHRIAWALATGAWPSFDIDHINGQRTDNRLCNLRDVPRAINLENQRNGIRENATGYLGVAEHYGKFRARIYVNRKAIRLGLFATPEAAYEAYLKAKRQLHAGCSI